ncbi:hypothetical protein T4A_12860 [Trichinella pseudospiralis]|uniref:Uncharacterized protein n=1 Tax=Trichinella pseudospiralis TaxID=6337 RepID=A0A0V1DLB9_TRIPS|nr:hypothetical protein T4A_12860 [Trichinella pseudospiralis]KRY98577.1 hypothetical protein T4C_3409 [Trichinella pseudospiralis]
MFLEWRNLIKKNLDFSKFSQFSKFRNFFSQ